MPRRNGNKRNKKGKGIFTSRKNIMHVEKYAEDFLGFELDGEYDSTLKNLHISARENDCKIKTVSHNEVTQEKINNGEIRIVKDAWGRNAFINESPIVCKCNDLINHDLAKSLELEEENKILREKLELYIEANAILMEDKVRRSIEKLKEQHANGEFDFVEDEIDTYDDEYDEHKVTEKPTRVYTIKRNNRFSNYK